MTGVGAYPGSFNPPTVAHLAIAEAALAQAGLDRIDLIVSRLALGKDAAARPRLDDRLSVLRAIASSRPWLAVRLTDAQLVADVAEGYDVVIVGADKWAQMNDPAWYGGSVAARDAAMARLPRVLIAPRGRQPAAADERRRSDGGEFEGGRTDDGPVGGAGKPIELLDIDPGHRAVSSTAARIGRRQWMAEEAAAFDAETGAWSDEERYAAWLASRLARANREADTAAQ